MMAQVEDSGTTAEGVKKSYVVDPSRPPRTKITYLTWTSDGLLRHTIYVGLRGQAGGSGAARSRTRLIRGSGQGSINQRQSGVDVKRTLRVGGDVAVGRRAALADGRLGRVFQPSSAEAALSRRSRKLAICSIALRTGGLT
jgi:hypothetical protein